MNIETQELETQAGSRLVLDPLQRIIRSMPKSLDRDARHLTFSDKLIRLSPETFVSIVPRGQVGGEWGTVFLPNGQLFAEVSVQYECGKLLEEHLVSDQFFGPLHKTSSSVAVLSCWGAEGYFHWMFDVLPRLNLLARSGIYVDRYFVNTAKRFQRECLTFLGIPDSKIIPAENTFYLEAEQLIVPSLPGITGNMPFWACQYLRNRFLRECGFAFSSKTNKRIFLSRRLADKRRIQNEQEIMQLLEQYGFETVLLETMSVAEQIKLFSSAEVVFGMHGAGLSNTVFCRPGTKVIEVFPKDKANVCYWALANQVGLDYYYMCAAENSATSEIDYEINLQDLSNILKTAGVV